MLYEIFPSAYAPLFATLVWSILIGVVGHYGVFKVRAFDAVLKGPMAPPFMALPAVLFAFLMGFMASAAWQNIALARSALVNEHSALTRLSAIPIVPPALKQQMQDGLKRYMAAVLDDEWAKHYNEASAPAAGAELDKLEAAMWSASQCKAQTPGDCTGGLAVSTYLKALDDLRAAREQRLSLGFQGTLRIKWVLGILLATATALSIAAIHRANPKTAVIAQVMFCFSAWMTFAMVTLHIQPYRGPDALLPSVLQDVRTKL